MELFKQFLQSHWGLILILLLGAILGLHQLYDLPSEMWGDATAHYSLAQAVRNGNLFFNYQFGGDGPIYTYLVVAVSWFLGLSFYTLKLTSVIVYIFFIVVMYYLANGLFKKKELAYITSFLTAVSFWSIVFARQPHARMLVPLFIATTLFFAVKNKTFLSGIFLGLGMYTQASFWAMPFVFWKRPKILLLGIILTIPLVINFASGKVGFFTNQSYFGEKLATSDHLLLPTILQNLLHNITANFFAFYTHGDEGFRLNVPNSPLLDAASAIFFSIGFLLLIYQVIKLKQTKYFEWIILPFFIIQIPSLLDIHNPLAQPNIGRMIGVIPFVYLSTTYGLTETWHFITNKTLKTMHAKKLIYYLCVIYILLIITIANVYKYFVIYPSFLPDHNTPFARIIAQRIDTYPPKATIIVIGSGWGEWGQPEQQAISDSTQKIHNILFLDPATQLSQLCKKIQSASPPIVIVTKPTDQIITPHLNDCKIASQAYLLEQHSFKIAEMIEITR